MKTKFIVYLDYTYYHSFCISDAFNVPTASFNPCSNCGAPDHGAGSCPHKKYQKKIAENKNKFIKMKQSQGESRVCKTWAKHSNKKGRTNKSQKQQKSDKKENGNGGNKSNNGVRLVYVKWLCLCNKGCGFNTSHTTGFHDTCAACVQNNQISILINTHVFQIKC